MTAHIAESVAGMTVIQTFQRESLFRSRFDDLNDANRVANTYAQRIVSVFFPSIELLGVLATIAVLAVGANVLPATQIGTLAAAYFLLSLAFQPLQSLSDVYSQLQSAQAAMAKVSLVLDEQPDIRSPDRPRTIGRVEGELTFERVHFAYGDREVLHGVELTIPPGACYAIVGESGGGKSTLAKLAARLYDPTRGAVLVDGIDLRELDLLWYRQQLGVVLQDPFLFSGTIAENLRFAKPQASDEEVSRIAQMVGLDAVARRFPAGFASDPRGWQRSFGGGAAVDLDRTGAAGRPTDPHLRRGDLEYRPPDRAADRARARPAPARADLDHHRPPPVDGSPGRPDRCD